MPDSTRRPSAAHAPCARSAASTGGAVWTLGWCETRDGICRFRVDRISDLQVLEERLRDESGKTLADLFRRVEASGSSHQPLG